MVLVVAWSLLAVDSDTAPAGHEILRGAAETSAKRHTLAYSGARRYKLRNTRFQKEATASVEVTHRPREGKRNCWRRKLMLANRKPARIMRSDRPFWGQLTRAFGLIRTQSIVSNSSWRSSRALSVLSFAGSLSIRPRLFLHAGAASRTWPGWPQRPAVRYDSTYHFTDLFTGEKQWLLVLKTTDSLAT